MILVSNGQKFDRCSKPRTRSYKAKGAESKTLSLSSNWWSISETILCKETSNGIWDLTKKKYQDYESQACTTSIFEKAFWI